jgi:hypothetical protein
LCCSIFREIWRHFNGSPLLCPINTTSSSSYVFRLRYPRVLHCRIVPIQMDYMTGHKSQKYNKYNVLSLVAVVANKRFVKIFTPLSSSPQGVFANLRVTFKLLLFNSDRTTVMGGFFPFKCN